ncbi:hypothetical protein B296_00017855 [Ensete ventricosum]|uniref:Uncharacterized protein n=1 Tax=Ensete ventricosum TaxID=4639 RepID=A0A427AHQ6_ENSVE|nr:hypothetical protein B296_00017855 [Ensete ventricosum]
MIWGNSPPPKAFLGDGVEREVQADFQGIDRDTQLGGPRVVWMLLGQRSTQGVLVQNTIALTDHIKGLFGHHRIDVMT